MQKNIENFLLNFFMSCGYLLLRGDEMKKYVYQCFSTDCGLACLKTMMNYYLDKEISYLGEEKEYSFLELQDIAHQNGLLLEGVQFENGDLNELKPCILLFEYEKMNHYVFFIKKKGKYMEIFDPQFGIRKLKMNDFLSYFTGYALITHQEKKKEKHHKMNFFYLKDILLECFILLPFFLLYFFFSKEQVFPYLILLSAVFLLFIDHIITLIRMQRFDKKLEVFIKEHPTLDEKIIQKLYVYKGAKFSYIKTMFIAFALQILFFMSCLETQIGLIFIPLYLLYFIYQSMFYYKRKEARIHLDYLERERKDSYEKYLTLNQYTKKYVVRHEIESYIIYILVALLNTIYYFILHVDLNILLPLSLFFIYLVSRNDIETFESLSRKVSIGEDLLLSLKKEE